MTQSTFKLSPRSVVSAVAMVCLSSVHAQVMSSATISSEGPVWTRHAIDRSSQGADGVKLGDLNGDGLPDMITGWEEGGQVRACLNPGTAKVHLAWPAVSIGMAGNVEDAIFTDLDGDGRLEAISATEGGTRTIYRHRFNGPAAQQPDAAAWRSDAFPATKGAQQWMQTLALDLDGQHGLDLLLGSKQKGATIAWLQSPESPDDLDAWTIHKLRNAGWIMSLIPHDVDGDGDADVVFTDRKGKRPGTFWLENPGAAANLAHTPWTEHAIGALNREVMFADLGDVNGDGREDVVVAVKPADLVICLRQPDGGWKEAVLTLDQTRLGDSKAVKIADLNLDGLSDLVFTCENAIGPREGVGWLEQSRSGPWLRHPLGGLDGVKFDMIQVLDLDGDEDLDVITCEERENLGVVWYENPLHGAIGQKETERKQ